MTIVDSLRQLVVRGKVPRKPHLDEIDERVTALPAEVELAATNNNHLYANADRTWPRDKALLVALGVDGDVPFEQAAINAGLHVTGKVRGVRFATKFMWGGGDAGPELFVPLGANDNHEIAAKAA